MKKILFLSIAVLGALTSNIYASSDSSSITDLAQIAESYKTGLLALQKPLKVGDPLPASDYWERENLDMTIPAKLHNTSEWRTIPRLTLLFLTGIDTPTCDKQTCHYSTQKPPYNGPTILVSLGNCDQAVQYTLKNISHEARSYVKTVLFNQDLHETLVYKAGLLEIDPRHRLHQFVHRTAIGVENGRITWMEKEESNADIKQTSMESIQSEWNKIDRAKKS